MHTFTYKKNCTHVKWQQRQTTDVKNAKNKSNKKQPQKSTSKVASRHFMPHMATFNLHLARYTHPHKRCAAATENVNTEKR